MTQERQIYLNKGKMCCSEGLRWVCVCSCSHTRGVSNMRETTVPVGKQIQTEDSKLLWRGIIPAADTGPCTCGTWLQQQPENFSFSALKEIWNSKCQMMDGRVLQRERNNASETTLPGRKWEQLPNTTEYSLSMKSTIELWDLSVCTWCKWFLNSVGI